MEDAASVLLECDRCKGTHTTSEFRWLASCTHLHGPAGTHVLDEAERSLHDALCVLSQTVKDSRVVFGGGWPEMQMAGVVQEQAARTPGKRSLAMEAFAHALRAIPATICDNAGEASTSPFASHLLAAVVHT